MGAFVWSHEPPESERPDRLDWETIQQIAQTDWSKQMSKILKKHGFKFVGPTTMYAFAQSMGLVNDHVESCHFRKTCEDDRTRFTRPVVSGS